MNLYTLALPTNRRVFQGMNETYQERTKHLNLQTNRVSKHDERHFTWKFCDHAAFELVFVFVVERGKFSPDWFICCWRHIVIIEFGSSF